MNSYEDPIIKKYIDTIKAGTSAFKVFYFGDPIRIPVSELPCLIVAKVDTRLSNMTNVEDMHQVRLSFTVVTDIRQTLSEDMHMVAGVNALYNLMEGRQDETYQLDPESLLYILRHNVELDTAQNLRTDLNTMTSISYGMTNGKRKEGAWSIEGTLRINRKLHTTTMNDKKDAAPKKLKVTSYITVDFPSLNWGINKGDTRELPDDEAARSIILATRGITLIK